MHNDLRTMAHTTGTAAVDQYAVNIQDEKRPLLASAHSSTEISSPTVVVEDPEQDSNGDLRGDSDDIEHFDRARYGTS